MHLHQVIQSKVNPWRKAGYPGGGFGSGNQDFYALPAPAGPPTVPVKIIDMSGEEGLATATV